jgi:hypothetical protein
MGKGKAQGPEALRHHPSPGALPERITELRAQLPGLLARGAEACGFHGHVWTAARGVQAIMRACGMSPLQSPSQSYHARTAEAANASQPAR